MVVAAKAGLNKVRGLLFFYDVYNYGRSCSAEELGMEESVRKKAMNK